MAVQERGCLLELHLPLQGTNEQLGQIATNKPRTQTDLQQIAGIGQAKVEKYDDRFLKIICEAFKG